MLKKPTKILKTELRDKTEIQLTGAQGPNVGGSPREWGLVSACKWGAISPRSGEQKHATSGISQTLRTEQTQHTPLHQEKSPCTYYYRAMNQF